MTLVIFTLVLDGMPWIGHHLPVFQHLSCDWKWVIAHGVAKNVRDTRWIQPQAPRLSKDGTTEYLATIKGHPRVKVIENELWDGKTDMCNVCLDACTPADVVMQIDSDELWSAEQIETIVKLFTAHEDVGAMQFWCRYMLGPNITIGPRNGRSYGCRQTEWTRAWRPATSSARFATHEPPVLPFLGRMMPRDETALYGLEFDHHAYATEAQVAYKERVYNYPGAVAGWKRLQANTVWPCKLKLFLPWVDEGSTADLLVR